MSNAIIDDPSQGSGQAYLEWTGSTSTMNVRSRYYYAGAMRVAMRTGSSTLNYFLGDHLGSTMITTDSNGQYPAEIRYYPWGTERYTSGTTPTTYHFTGQRVESGIGLYFYGARWYDPSAGRFVQGDTLVQGTVQGLDRFAYVKNSPLKYIDPNGHWACTEKQAAIGYEVCDQNRTVDELEDLLDFLFTWDTVGEWSKKELLTLLNAGKDIQSSVDKNTNSNIGTKWIRKYLGDTSFKHGNRINSFIGAHTVFWKSEVFLLSNFNKTDVVHELGHVLDNNTGDSNGFPATWVGGGVADGLMEYIGGSSILIRWLPFGCGNLSEDDQWTLSVDHAYGNTSSAEYFAQTFKFYIYDPSKIPGGIGPGSARYFMDAFIDVTTNFLIP